MKPCFFKSRHASKFKHTLLLSIFICIHHENNILFISFSFYYLLPWHENLKYLTNWLVSQKKLSRTLTMPMSSEKLNPSFCQLYLVSIWSLLVRPLAVQKPVFVAYRPSFVSTFPVGSLAPKNEVDDDVKICLSSKKSCFSSHFNKEHVTANLSWWSRFARPMKKRSRKESRPLQSTDSWRGMTGPHPRPTTHRSRIESNPNEPSGQISSGTFAANRPPICLGLPISNAPRRYSCRSYLPASGGH